MKLNELGWLQPICILFLLLNAAVGNAYLSPNSIQVEYGNIQNQLASANVLNVSDILASNKHFQAVVAGNVQGILERLDEGSTCGIEAAVRLIEGCQKLGNKSEVNFLLEDVKTLYSVRMAVCETADGGARTPMSCQYAMSMMQTGTDRQTYTDADLSFIDSGALPACVRSLQLEHYYWTSYSNHRQDAAALCGASSTEAEKRKLMATYRDITNSLHDISQVVHNHVMTSEEWFGKADIRASKIDAAYEAMMQNHKEQLNSHTEKALEGFEAISLAAMDSNDAVTTIHKALYDALATANKITSDTQNILPGIRTDVARMVVDVSADLAGSFSQHARQVEIAMSSIASLSDMIVSGPHVEALKAMGSTVRSAYNVAEESFAIQQQHQPLLMQQQDILMNNIERQLDAQALSNDILADLHIIANSVSIIAGPIQAVSSVIRIFQQSSLQIGAVDIATFGLFGSASALLLLTAGHRLKGVSLALVYCFTTSCRVILSTSDILGQLRILFNGLSHEVLVHNKLIALMIKGLCLILIVRLFIIFIEERDDKNDQTRRLMMQADVTGQARGHQQKSSTARELDVALPRSTRAGTTPPGL